MFTGIITAIGTVTAAEDRGDRRVTVRVDDATFARMPVAMGASIACSGACMTVVDQGTGPDGWWFAVDVSGESIARTAAGHWDMGARLNLERALRVGDELGGHIVTGHVDGVGAIAAITPVGDSWTVTIGVPADLAPYIAAKGSLTVDGVSLTVNAVTDTDKGTMATLNIIPHTRAVTTLSGWQVGAAVNLEIDVLARYLARLNQTNSRVSVSA